MARQNWSHVAFPHPAGRRPYVGDLPTVLRGNRAKPLQRMLELSADLGPIFEIKIFGQKMVFVRDGELAAELCDESRFEKKLAPGVKALRDFAGDGLFTAYTHEPNWRLAHDLLRPAFTRQAMQRYHHTMLEVAAEMIDVFDRSSGPVDVSNNLTKLTLETIGRTSFSKDFGSFTKTEQDPFIAAMIASLRRGQRRGSLAAMPGAKYLLRRKDTNLAEQRDYIDNLIDGIIAERLRTGDTSQNDLLGLMLNAAHETSGQKLDTLNIRYQILTFLVAGHETTSGALSFALYYLATNPEIRATAQAETDAILGADPDAEPTFEQVAKFRYIRRVLDEALRLWPTAPGFARGPIKDTVIGGKYPMRTSDYVIVAAVPAQRDPQIWGPDADTFDPDRFLPANIKKRPAHTYFPFGTGERACIGRQFALHEAVLVLARMLHKYDFETQPDYELSISERLTLMPEGMYFDLIPRVPAVVSIDDPAADDSDQATSSASDLEDTVSHSH